MLWRDLTEIMVINKNISLNYSWWHQMETFSELMAKHLWGWWFETPSRPLWRHCNGHRESFYKAFMSLWLKSFEWFNYCNYHADTFKSQNSHLLQQLSSAKCRIMSWSDHCFLSKHNMHFRRFGLWAHKHSVKWSQNEWCGNGPHDFLSSWKETS